MININDIYSRFLCSEDLVDIGPEGVEVTISGVDVVEVPDPKDLTAAARDKRDPRMLTKLQVCFNGVKRPLLLNKTNAKSIAAVLNARDAEQWVGRKLTLLVRKVRMGAEVTEAIRIRMPPAVYAAVSNSLRRKLWEGGPE